MEKYDRMGLNPDLVEILKVSKISSELQRTVNAYDSQFESIIPCDWKSDNIKYLIIFTYFSIQVKLSFEYNSFMLSFLIELPSEILVKQQLWYM